jgi:serine/threonine-protein kinase
MGAVYRATHVTMNRDVALKIIDPRKVKDKSIVDRFRREVQVSVRLQHEHIVQAFDVGVHGGVSFLVLEFVEGADLSEIVKRDGPMRPV